ncbi:hypothetical protein ACP275_12G067300 [Erythranthe tilingii]
MKKKIYNALLPRQNAQPQLPNPPPSPDCASLPESPPFCPPASSPPSPSAKYSPPPSADDRHQPKTTFYQPCPFHYTGTRGLGFAPTGSNPLVEEREISGCNGEKLANRSKMDEVEERGSQLQQSLPFLVCVCVCVLCFFHDFSISQTKSWTTKLSWVDCRDSASQFWTGETFNIVGW